MISENHILMFTHFSG